MKKILVVDDSVTMRQLMKMVLVKHFPCQVTEAQDGVDALEKFGQAAFDLVVTDVNMPRMDGLGLVRELRQVAGSAVPIIIVTTKGGEADRDTGMQLGASAYLTKPINGSQVVATVAGFIG